MRFDTIHRYNDEIKRIDKALDENYTELRKNDELAIARAEAQLELITSIINEVERI